MEKNNLQIDEVINYVLLSTLKISGCNAGCLLKIFRGKREILSARFNSKPADVNYSKSIIDLFDEHLQVLTKTRDEELNRPLPVVCYCKQLTGNKKDGTRIFFIITAPVLISMKPGVTKSIEVLVNALGEFYPSLNKYSVNANTVLSEDGEVNPFFQLSDDLFFTLDENGKFVKANSGGASMLEYSVEELIKFHLIDLIPAHLLKDFTKYFSQLIKYNTSNPFRTSLLKSNGEEINIQLRCKLLIDGNKLNSVYGIASKPVEDSYIEKLHFLNQKLTATERILNIERMRVNHQKAILEELNRMKNDFISNISHEFRTPLASIIGFSETIDSETDISDEMREEFNREILNESKRLARLINDVLNSSRVTGKKIMLNKTLFDIVSLIKEIINANSASMKVKNIILSPDLPLIETVIFADRTKISQVITLLLQHSISSSLQKGRISILLSDYCGEIELIISDTGYGISEKEITKFFELQRSVQTENFTSNLHHSLVFAKQIVDLHDGLFTFESEINKGTSFVIKLPGIVNL